MNITLSLPPDLAANLPVDPELQATVVLEHLRASLRRGGASRLTPRERTEAIAGERLVTNEQARYIIGTETMPCSGSRVCALRNICSIPKKARYFKVSVLLGYLKLHPEFSERQVYRQKGSPGRRSPVASPAVPA